MTAFGNPIIERIPPRECLKGITEERKGISNCRKSLWSILIRKEVRFVGNARRKLTSSERVRQLKAKKIDSFVPNAKKPFTFHTPSIPGFASGFDPTERGILYLLAAMFLIFSVVAFRELYLGNAHWLFPPNP